MKQFPLRLRLFTASAISIIIALFIAGISIAAIFANHVENGITKDLISQFDRLVSLIDAKASPPALKAPLADPAFSKPYGGLYWQITDANNGEKARSRSMWDEEFILEDNKLLDGKLHKTELIDPEGTLAIAIVQRLTFDSEDGSKRLLDVIMAEDLLAFYEANAAFRRDLILSLSLLAIFLLIAAWLQIVLGLSPLKIIKKQVSAIRNGSAKRLGENHPIEVMPLVEEVNELLETQEKYIIHARERAANLAHGLKTSLTVLSSEADNIRKLGNEESAAIIEQITDDMQSIIDHQLRLSRLKTRSSSEHFQTKLLANIKKIVATLKRTPKGNKLNWKIEIDKEICVNIEQADLLELLGILLENATNWAKNNIFIRAEKRKEKIYLYIEDDGKGISNKKLKLLGKRGIRLDSQGSGSGIGLAIAAEIVAMNSGEINFSKSKQGGLLVKIRLNCAKNIQQ